MKFAVVLLWAGCALTMKAGAFCTVSPGVWCEQGVGDAGSLPATSEPTLGTGALNSIIGQIGDGTAGADMYSILITNPAAFSANFAAYAANNVPGLTQAALYLFDSNGDGIEAADDGSVALGSFTGPAGIYYIDIVPDGNTPQYRTGGNNFPIFTAFSSGVISLPVGGAGTIRNYSQNGCGTACQGGYDITFAGGGVQYSNLPEPASMLLTGAVLVGLGAVGIKRKKRYRLSCGFVESSPGWLVARTSVCCVGFSRRVLSCPTWRNIG
jgi:hypothetical protein